MTTYDLIPQVLHEKEEPKKKFTPKDLNELNLEQEILENYNSAKWFLSNIPLNTPANQVAQVMNTINSILSNLTKLQMEIYNSERMKRLETSLVQAIKRAPKDVQEVFFDDYERILKENDQL